MASLEVNEMINKLKDNKGVTTVEYAVMLVLIAIAVMSASPNISSAVLNVFATISTKLTA